MARRATWASLDLRVVDGTNYLLHLKRDAHAEYLAGAYPGRAVFFARTTSPTPRRRCPTCCPRRRPSPRAIGALGIGDGDRVVAYGGGKGMIASRAVWWTFRAFGSRPRGHSRRRAAEVGGRRPSPKR